ncbi:XRE family transcriptional regulator [Candidatus Sodalis endolongispinus]|uniref:XRE family transcriptional regulator n=2 Tax=Candidatus Sodalis endolongispinus TaxID=2812662 RepID=A0ABS5YDG0_9GAMM|nr:XRE family transcriptional regulator [Candidatus Sodalis endolongispinus]MBT9433075.1 XRE family transcriptional regulator [Candidatus Sodalis endolongispinus]
MTSTKSKPLSLQFDGKESFKDRLRMLIGNRSVRAAAKDWGIPTSTLNNHLSKNTQPLLSMVQIIAHKESVGIDWLVNGQQAQQDVSLPDDQDLQDLNAILRSLEPVERKKLARLLGRKGAEVLALLLEQGGLDLLKLSGEQRTAALSLQELPADRVREILHAIKQCSTLTKEVNYKY